MNPTSTQVLGKVPAIFRDDNASYYTCGTLADNTAETLCVAADLPESGLYVVALPNFSAIGIYAIYNDDVVLLYTSTASKFTATWGTTANDPVNFDVNSSSLKIENQTGGSLTGIRIYRLA
jgi:hypothetical protein